MSIATEIPIKNILLPSYLSDILEDQYERICHDPLVIAVDIVGKKTIQATGSGLGLEIGGTSK